MHFKNNDLDRQEASDQESKFAWCLTLSVLGLTSLLFGFGRFVYFMTDESSRPSDSHPMVQLVIAIALLLIFVISFCSLFFVEKYYEKREEDRYVKRRNRARNQ
ncbi:hypothetical protein ACXR2T_07940 [Leucobacter sp. HY1910]